MSADDDFGRLFGINLKAVRQAAGLSQEELGFRAGLHRTEIGMLERGIRIPRVDTLVRLCGSIGCDPNRLCSGLSWTAREVSPGGFNFDDSTTEAEADDDP